MNLSKTKKTNMSELKSPFLTAKEKQLAMKNKETVRMMKVK